jgi:hypothetical protein
VTGNPISRKKIIPMRTFDHSMLINPDRIFSSLRKLKLHPQHGSKFFNPDCVFPLIVKPEIKPTKTRFSSSLINSIGKGGVLPDEFNFEALERVKWDHADPDHLFDCNTGYIYGRSKDRHFFKAVQCGKEYCATCGKDKSNVHVRRIDRVSNRITAITTEFIRDKKGQPVLDSDDKPLFRNLNLGYIVITCPDEYRDLMDVKALKSWKIFWKRKLKRSETIYLEPIKARDHKTKRLKKRSVKIKRKGINRGLIRYHWCGDDGITFKPHLNILIPKGYIDPRILHNWKVCNSLWFATYFQTGEIPSLNLYYRYTKNKVEQAHIIKYVTRSTFKQVTPENQHLLSMLHGFRNTTFFGKKINVNVIPDQYEFKRKVVESVDPVDDSPIVYTHFTRVLHKHIDFQYRHKLNQLDGGYFMVHDAYIDIDPVMMVDLSDRKKKRKFDRSEHKPPPNQIKYIKESDWFTFSDQMKSWFCSQIIEGSVIFVK